MGEDALVEMAYSGADEDTWVSWLFSEKRELLVPSRES